MGVIQVVEVSESSVKINTDAVDEILEKVADLPVVVLSVSGGSREGKSYLLNYFVRYLKAQGEESEKDWFNLKLSPEEMFPVKSGRERVTVGLNMYPQPFIISTKYESKLAVLLLDSQGLFDHETTFKQNAVIFALTNLFSSVMIYNVKCKIEENLLRNIQFFSSYAQAITIQAEAEDKLPSLIFLLRDFAFEGEFPLGYHSPRSSPKDGKIQGNYFQCCFSPSSHYQPTYDRCIRNLDRCASSSSSPAVMPAENKIVRKEILKKYPQTGIFLLPFPGKEFLNDPLNQIPNQDFRNYLHRFITMMSTDEFLLPKNISGKELTGKDLQTKFLKLALLCKESASNFPPAGSLADSHNMMLNEMAVFSSFDIFRERFEDFFSTSTSRIGDSKLKAKYDELLSEAGETYKKLRRTEMEANMAKYLNKLNEVCRDIFENYYVKLNAGRSQSLANHLDTERGHAENLQTLRNQILTFQESCPPLLHIDPKKPPAKPKRIFTAKISQSGNLVPGQGPMPLETTAEYTTGIRGGKGKGDGTKPPLLPKPVLQLGYVGKNTGAPASSSLSLPETSDTSGKNSWKPEIKGIAGWFGRLYSASKNLMDATEHCTYVTYIKDACDGPIQCVLKCDRRF